MQIKLSYDQQCAYDAMYRLLADKNQRVLCVTGEAGTGKTTMLAEFIKNFRVKLKALNNLIGNYNYLPTVTATTNKAVDALRDSLNKQTDGTDYYQVIAKQSRTIHSVLGLKVTNHNFTSSLVDTGKSVPPMFLIIDESSYIDEELHTYIMQKCSHCKIVFMGDPCQLPPVKSDIPYVFDQGYPTVHMSQILRQANGNPIQQLSRDLRAYVNGEDLPNVTPDGKNIIHIEDPEEFQDELINSFKHAISTKYIGYTNAKVNLANEYIKDVLKNSPFLDVGDYAICNKYIKHPQGSIKTDETVHIREVHPAHQVIKVDGQPVNVIGQSIRIDFPPVTVFVPHDKAVFTYFEGVGNRMSGIDINKIVSTWADLRPQYACTIHKSQGSTYDNVFIDLDDFAGIKDEDKLSRLLYVAISRARNKVVLTGNL